MYDLSLKNNEEWKKAANSKSETKTRFIISFSPASVPLRPYPEQE